MSTTFCNGLGMSTSDGFFGFSAIEITYLSSFRTGGLTSQRFQAANQQNMPDVLRLIYGPALVVGPALCTNNVQTKWLTKAYFAGWRLGSGVKSNPIIILLLAYLLLFAWSM